MTMAASAHLWRQRRWRLTLLAAVLTAGALAAAFAWRRWPPLPAVTAQVETHPVPSHRDAADDPAIWVHPGDPARSVVIGTDKRGGLAVYDLAGSQLQYLAAGRLNNVDVRYDFLLGGELVDLVVTSDRGARGIATFCMDPATRTLAPTGTIATDTAVYGLCLYRSPRDGQLYCFVSDEAGPVIQVRLADDGHGQVTGTVVRTLPFASIVEGLVADDARAVLYVGEENVALWQCPAEPDASATERLAIDRVGAGRLDADLEGLALYHGLGESGYLLASSQGDDRFTVYRRGGDHACLGQFVIAAGPTIDAVTGTDGIEVCAAALGPAFPHGLFVAQDTDNDGANQNFKLVDWGQIARAFVPPLSIATDYSPRPAP